MRYRRRGDFSKKFFREQVISLLPVEGFAQRSERGALERGSVTRSRPEIHVAAGHRPALRDFLCKGRLRKREDNLVPPKRTPRIRFPVSGILSPFPGTPMDNKPDDLERILWELMPLAEAAEDQMALNQRVADAIKKALGGIAREHYPSMNNWEPEQLKELAHRISRIACDFAVDLEDLNFASEKARKPTT